MKRVLFVSDTHGDASAFSRLDLTGVDEIVHLGDGAFDGEYAAMARGIPYAAVRGNNDFGAFDAFETNVSAVIACFNNVGPGSGAVGPTGNYAGYTIFAKLVLCFDMLLGRLEILPILLLFNFKSWKKA